MSVQKLDTWYLFFSSIYIGDWDRPSWSLLSLRTHTADAVVYEKDRESIIDYPWEYELSWYHIFAFSNPWNDLLSYIISFKNNNIAFVQCKEILDDDRIADMDTWYVTSDSLRDQIEKRELEGEIQLLEE